MTDIAKIDGLSIPVGGIFDEIGDTALAAPAASVSFAGIPAGYAFFLLLMANAYILNAAAQSVNLTFNADGGANYDYSKLMFSAAPATTNNANFISIGTIGDTTTHHDKGSGYYFIFNRATYEKHVIGTHMHNHTAGAQINDIWGYHIEAKWRNTADEISTVTITSPAGNFDTGTRFILLGVST